MRTKNTVRNSLVTLVFQVIVMLIGFIVPRAIISVYGSEVNGLTSNINQILGIINLLQAGVVGASIYEMYKPIAEEDYLSIGSIFYSSEKYFSKMSIWFLFLSFLIIPYILLDSGSGLNAIDVVLSVLILGFNGAFVFKYYCKYDVIFSAFQQKHILVISMAVERVVYYVLLLLILYFKWHYIYIYLATFIGSFVRIMILKMKFSQTYEKQIEIGKAYNDYKVKNQFHLLGNQIVQNIIESMPIILVTSGYGLKYASVLSVYLLVINIFKMVFSTLQNSVAASFGDYATRNEPKRIVEIFSTIQVCFSGVATIAYICLAMLYLPFVKLYCDGATTFSYVFVGLGFSLTVYIIAYTSFLPYNMVINALGMYGNVLRENILCGIVSMVIMIISSFISFECIYIGVAIFYISSLLHRFILLRKNGISLKIEHINNSLFPIAIVSTISFLGSDMIICSNWLEWLISAFIVGIITCIVVSVIGLIFRREYIKILYGYLKLIINK